MRIFLRISINTKNRIQRAVSFNLWYAVIDGWFPFAILSCFYLWLALLLVFIPKSEGNFKEIWSHKKKVVTPRAIVFVDGYIFWKFLYTVTTVSLKFWEENHEKSPKNLTHHSEWILSLSLSFRNWYRILFQRINN